MYFPRRYLAKFSTNQGEVRVRRTSSIDIGGVILAWLALVMIFTFPDNMESQRALESLKSRGRFGGYSFNTDLIRWGTVVEEIDPDNKPCPYKRWLKFGGLQFWRMMISYRLRKTLWVYIPENWTSILLQVISVSFFGNLKMNWPLFFLGRPPVAVSYWGQKIDDFLLSNTTAKKDLGLTSIGTCSLRCRNRHARKKNTNGIFQKMKR